MTKKIRYFFFLISLIIPSLTTFSMSSEMHIDNMEDHSIAKNMYFNILVTTTNDISIRKRALDRFARLSVTEGAVARNEFGMTNERALDVFNTCIDATDYLSPQEIGKEIAEYVYWRATCIALWAANIEKTKFLHKKNRSRIEELRELVATGLARYKTFDGYGFNRIQAGMFIRSKPLKAFGLYQPAQALALLDEALSGGTDVYFAYILKAEALIEMKRKNEAQKTLTQGIENLRKRLKNGDMPTYLVADNKVFLQDMEQMLENI